MSRRIVSVELQAAGRGPQLDTYFDRVVKYIPVDIVSAWVFLSAAIEGTGEDVPKFLVLWILFTFFLPLTALWTWKHTSEPNLPPARTQIVVSVVAFIVWVIALGGPFKSIVYYRNLYGSIILVLFTLVIGLLVPDDKPPKAPSPTTP
jgi:hypothetical protein